MDLPAELRDRIYQLCFSEEVMVVFARPSPIIKERGAPKHPTATKPVASKYRLIFPGIHATFGDTNGSRPSTHEFSLADIGGAKNARPPAHIFSYAASGNAKKPPSSTRKFTDWAISRTGILYTRRSIYLEAVQHLYKSSTFSFEDPGLSKKFLDTVGPRNLEHVTKIAVYYHEETNVSMFRWRLMCQQIVRSLPKVEELTIWIESIVELEHGGHLRCYAYEAALRDFIALKQIASLVVKKHAALFDNSNDDDVQWHAITFMNEYTINGVKEMVQTGDHSALDKQSAAFRRDYGW